MNITTAVADAGPTIDFFAFLGFKGSRIIDGGLPARYMGMPDMKAQHITLALEGTIPISKFSFLSLYRPQGPIRVRTQRTCDD